MEAVAFVQQYGDQIPTLALQPFHAKLRVQEAIDCQLSRNCRSKYPIATDA